MFYNPQKYLYYIDEEDRRDAALLAEQIKEIQNSSDRGRHTKKMRFPIFDPAGPGAEEIMKNWESQGVPFPETCVDPEKLLLYFRGKLNRDRCVTEWRKAVCHSNPEFRFQPEEFFESIDYDCEEFKAIFGRFPDFRVLKAWILFEQLPK